MTEIQAMAGMAPLKSAFPSEIEAEIEALKEDNRELWAELAETRRQMAELRRDISELRREREIGTPRVRKETAQDHLDRLFSEMRKLGLRQVGVVDAARLIGLSKRQMSSVKPAIYDDPRFALVVDPKIHKQRHLIRIV